MPQFVRGGIRYNRWLETEGRQPLDFPADVITDLLTKGDELSVFEIAEGGPISAERVAIALIAHKPSPIETHYAVFDRAAVEAMGIEIIKRRGGTHDAEVNDYHYDLRVRTAANLVRLAGIIAAGKLSSILKARATELLREGFEAGRLDYTQNKTLARGVHANIPGLAQD